MEVVEILEEVADVSDMKNSGSLFSDVYIRLGLARINPETAQALREASSLLRNLAAAWDQIENNTVQYEKAKASVFAHGRELDKLRGLLRQITSVILSDLPAHQMYWKIKFLLRDQKILEAKSHE